MILSMSSTLCNYFSCANRVSAISRHPLLIAPKVLRFADHVTKRNEGSGEENGRQHAYFVKILKMLLVVSWSLKLLYA